MRNEEAPRPDLRGASKDHQDRSRSFQDTAPGLYCRCPRQGDLWLCAGRPGLVSHPDGSQCALGATIRLTGRDIDPRELLARALKGECSHE